MPQKVAIHRAFSYSCCGKIFTSNQPGIHSLEERQPGGRTPIFFFLFSYFFSSPPPGLWGPAPSPQAAAHARGGPVPPRQRRGRAQASRRGPGGGDAAMFLCAALRAAAARSVRGRRVGGRLCATRGLGAALGRPGPSGGDSGKGIAPSRGRPRRLVAAGGLLWGRGALRCVRAGG